MAFASNRSSQGALNENQLIQVSNSAETSRAEIEILNVNDENTNPVESLVNRTVELDSNDDTNVNRSIIEETDEENDDVDDYEQEYASKAKMPRLGSITNLKDHQKENENKNQEPENDEDACSICLEPFTNSGVHRLVCLKCGHIFGEGCIDRWLKSNQKCPQCNRPSKRSDIRRIYAKSIKVLDTAELDQALKDIETERQLRRKAEILASEMKLQYQMVNDELVNVNKKYRELFERFQSGACSSGASSSNLYSELVVTNSSDLASNDSPMNFKFEKLINLNENQGGSRIVCFSHRTSAILASQPATNPIFPGYGVKKINFLDYKISQYIPIHSKMIRDMALSNQNNDEILLSCGLDKMLKLTNIATNRIIHSYECTHPIWSCCYNLDNPIYFYAGLANGQVLMFDKRKIDTFVQSISPEINNGSPVCSLQYVPRSTLNPSGESGLVVAQLDKLAFYQTNQNNEHKYSPLLMDTNIMSCHFDTLSRHLLVSTRPMQKYPNVRHFVYEITTTAEANAQLNLIQTFNGSNVQKMLARSKLFCFNSELYGCSPCERTKTAVIWNVSSGKSCLGLTNTSEILDVCPINSNGSQVICTLTDKQLRVFRTS